MGNDADDSKWGYPAHTKAKHEMLSRYLGGWYPILSTWNGRIVFLDGFAGRGRYTDGSEGSPLIALRRLLDHAFFPQMKHREFIYYFIEANRINAEQLSNALDELKREYCPWPGNVKIHVVNQPFDVTASSMIDTLREQKKSLAPTFAFIDPFGYSGLPMDLIADLLDYPRTEVFINFMVGHVQRFIEREKQERVMRELFGKDVAEILRDYDQASDRVDHLRQVYESQLQERAKFTYVQSFAMINKTGNISYYLVHGTRHIKGVKLMKNAMWAVDPGGGFQFSDRLAGQDVLFQTDPNLGPLRADLLQRYSGTRSITVPEIEDYTVVHTPYRTTHVRPVLRLLEKEGVITVDRSSGARQFANGVIISFP